jgi:DhnA family fructose-bisphosphate aldolase class Ia
MNLTNRIENILIAAAAAIIAGLVVFAIMKGEVNMLNKRIDKQNEVIVKLAQIEKYKIENRFDQVKAKDGQIIMSLDNTLTALQLDSIKPKPVEKKSFWKKLKFW